MSRSRLPSVPGLSCMPYSGPMFLRRSASFLPRSVLLPWACIPGTELHGSVDTVFFALAPQQRRAEVLQPLVTVEYSGGLSGFPPRPCGPVNSTSTLVDERADSHQGQGWQPTSRLASGAASSAVVCLLLVLYPALWDSAPDRTLGTSSTRPSKL